MRISDWSSDVCSSDLAVRLTAETAATPISAAAFAARLDPLVDPGGGPVTVAVSGGADSTALLHLADVWARERTRPLLVYKIGRASCRERVCQYVSISVVAVDFKKKQQKNYIDE